MIEVSYLLPFSFLLSSNTSTFIFYSFLLEGTIDLESRNASLDPHSISGLLKLFFRNLPQPVLLFKHYNDLITIASM